MTKQEALKWFQFRKKMCLSDRTQEAEDIAIECIAAVIAQEPRVLSLSELEDTLDTDTVVWLELRSNKMRQGHALVMSYSHAYGIMHIDTPFGDGPSQKIFNYAEYCTTWRCWSVKPTKEQRVKEKWG